MQKLIFFLLCCGFFCHASAQTTISVPGSNNPMIVKDPRIDRMIHKQIYTNMLAIRNTAGYRVQVISTMDRNRAMDIKAQLMQLYPDYRTYLSYQSPYFRVRIGDFPDQDSAAQLQEELSKTFPSGVFTVRDIININPEKDLFKNDDTNH